MCDRVDGSTGAKRDVPQDVRNLLVVGKATAAGQDMWSAHAVLFQGQAAGIAAAMAVEGGKAMSEIGHDTLQRELRNAGVAIP